MWDDWMTVERLWILAKFGGGLIVLCGISSLLAVLGGMNDEAPSAPVRSIDRPRSSEALRTGSRVIAVRGLPGRNARLVDRIERRRVEAFLCGVPNHELVAAERMRQSAQRCQGGDAA
jgi:hypothetical protein